MLRGWITSKKAEINATTKHAEPATEHQNRRISCLYICVKEANLPFSGSCYAGYGVPKQFITWLTHIAVLTAVAFIMDDDLEAAEHGLRDGHSSFHKVNLHSFSLKRLP